MLYVLIGRDINFLNDDIRNAVPYKSHSTSNNYFVELVSSLSRSSNIPLILLCAESVILTKTRLLVMSLQSTAYSSVPVPLQQTAFTDVNMRNL